MIEPDTVVIDENTGIARFHPVWFSQFLPALAGGVINFGIAVWAFRTTASVTALALVGMSAVIPRACSSLFAGAMVDRHGPRRSILIGNLGAIIALAPSLFLFSRGQLAVWHVCVSIALASLFQSLLWPAVLASIPVLVGKKHFVRANGILQASNAVTSIVAPLIAGVVMLHYNVGGLLLLGLFMYVAAIPALALTRIPRPEKNKDEKQSRSFIREINDAWAFLRVERDLLRLVVIFGFFSFVISIASILLKPLVLSFASASALGTVISIGGVGMLLGSLAVTMSGKGPTSIKEVMLALTVVGLSMTIAGSRPMLVLIAIATFLYSLTMPVVSSGIQTIIQTRVPADLQGRMHATLAATGFATMPFAYLLAGPLADYVFNPLMVDGGILASSVGRIIGVGESRGVGLLYILLGVVMVGLSIVGQLEPQKQTYRANALVANE
jgi:DHA3 family macrolide efflux protein-like MFS transporter